MAGTYAGKVALVTGAGQNIGRATALRFAGEGAKVAVVDIVAETGMETVRMIKEQGGEAIFVHTDVTKAREVEAMVAATVDAFGRLDCAFNNAGGAGQYYVPLVECTEDKWARTIAFNLTSIWLCMKYQIPQMVKQGGGAIVNAGSLVAWRPLPCWAPTPRPKAGCWPCRAPRRWSTRNPEFASTSPVRVRSAHTSMKNRCASWAARARRRRCRWAVRANRAR